MVVYALLRFDYRAVPAYLAADVVLQAAETAAQKGTSVGVGLFRRGGRRGRGVGVGGHALSRARARRTAPSPAGAAAA